MTSDKKFVKFSMKRRFLYKPGFDILYKYKIYVVIRLLYSYARKIDKKQERLKH